MAILAVGGEADCYNPVTGQVFAHETNTARYETTASRVAMLVRSAVSEIRLSTPAMPATFWTHMRIYQEAIPVVAADYILWENGPGTETAYKVVFNTDGTWTFRRYSGAAFVTIGTTASAVISNAAAEFDFEITRDSVTGKFNVYKDGASIFSFSGNTSTDSNVASIRFGGCAQTTEEMMLSQVIVADVSTISMKLVTQFPDGNGFNTSWANDYQNIDEAVYNSGDFIETNTVGAIETSTTSNINAAYAAYNVAGVAVAGRFSNDPGSVITDVQAAIRTASTNYFSANLSLPKDGLERSVQAVFNTNPNTSAVWTQAEVNATEVGVKAV
jgi:hypothetical protein